MRGKSLIPYTPIKIMYQTAVVFVGLFLLAFLWYALYSCIAPLRAATISSMEQFENMTSYAHFELADAFMNNLWVFFMVIVATGLLYWSWLYAQWKNEGVHR